MLKIHITKRLMLETADQNICHHVCVFGFLGPPNDSHIPRLRYSDAHPEY
jgi:hypothetical protein